MLILEEAAFDCWAYWIPSQFNFARNQTNGYPIQNKKFSLRANYSEYASVEQLMHQSLPANRFRFAL